MIILKRMLPLVPIVALALGGCGGRGGGGDGRHAGPELVEGGVIFRFHDTDAKRVFVVGDFNGWSLRADPMVDKNGDGEWSLFYPLPPGVYQYKFVIDGTEWIHDPRNPETTSDGFKGLNSVVRVPKTRA